MKVRVVGVRHHSPACAGLVDQLIREHRPRAVLVEGPADFNDRIPELLLEHHLPLAIFSYYQGTEVTHSCWTPFCDYSPEWVALRTGAQVGAQLFFMDLPAWSRPFYGVRNRYSDGERVELDYLGELGRRLKIEGLDALWDHLFEQPCENAELVQRLEHYFQALRACPDEVSDRDLERERFMAGFLRWAAGRFGDVLAVCGGFHKPYLEEHWPTASHERPRVPQPETGSRHGSFLVPYSFRRLDSFAGYAAGMPSPGYYQAVWDQGADGAAREMRQLVTRRLRSRKQPISAADLIAAQTMTEGLQRLRSHSVPSRVDLLDGLAAGLVKEALEQPLPWTRRSSLQRGTHPLLVELVSVFSGERKGELDPRTPAPPLLEHVRGLLAAHDLRPASRPRNVRCSPASPRSHILHRLRLLKVGGFRRLEKARGADPEVWELRQRSDFESDLIEASAWGGTLEQAARARLEEDLRTAEGLEPLAVLVVEALEAGLRGLGENLVGLLREKVEQESRFARLGLALRTIFDLYRRRPEPILEVLLQTLTPRALWLLEGENGPSAPADRALILGVGALRDTLRHSDSLLLDRVAGLELFRRRALDPAAQPAVRGACLGSLWSLDTGGALQQLQTTTLAAVRENSLPPSRLGDFLAGLFGLAREEVVGVPGLLESVDQVICGQEREDFLRACPSLRLAFSYFPPREREAIALTVSGLHGATSGAGRQLVELAEDPQILLANARLEAEVDALMDRFGLTS